MAIQSSLHSESSPLKKMRISLVGTTVNLLWNAELEKCKQAVERIDEQRNGDSRPWGQLLDPTQASMLKPCGVVGQAAGYGLLFASPDNLLVSTINGTGIVIETIYVFFFLFYAPRKDKMKIYAPRKDKMNIYALHSFRCLLRVYFCISSLLCGLLLLLQ